MDWEIQNQDKQQVKARNFLRGFFELEENRSKVFYSRQIEVLFENDYYHWITNRAIRDLIELDHLKTETFELKNAGSLNVIWHKSYRYYKRSAKELISLVDDYSNPNVSASVGLNGELLVLEAFARNKFLMIDRDSNSIDKKTWDKTNHNLDFIFEKDNIYYGMEVKNMLGYMELEELEIKLEMCEYLGVLPLFVNRMLPRSWSYKIIKQKGYSLIMKYQLYPISHKDLAKRVHNNLGLFVDSPRRIEQGTMERVLKWHQNNVNLKKKSH